MRASPLLGALSLLMPTAGVAAATLTLCWDYPAMVPMPTFQLTSVIVRAEGSINETQDVALSAPPPNAHCCTQVPCHGAGAYAYEVRAVMAGDTSAPSNTLTRGMDAQCNEIPYAQALPTASTASTPSTARSNVTVADTARAPSPAMLPGGPQRGSGQMPSQGSATQPVQMAELVETADRLPAPDAPTATEITDAIQAQEAQLMKDAQIPEAMEAIRQAEMAVHQAQEATLTSGATPKSIGEEPNQAPISLPALQPQDALEAQFDAILAAYQERLTAIHDRYVAELSALQAHAGKRPPHRARQLWHWAQHAQQKAFQWAKTETLNLLAD